MLDSGRSQAYWADDCLEHFRFRQNTVRRRAMGSTIYGAALPNGATLPKNMSIRDGRSSDRTNDRT